MPQKKNGEGLPIKAICRDTLVGIRYLSSKDDAPLPVSDNSDPELISPQRFLVLIKIYNRIQINFISTKDAAEFIHSIRTVCPCKTATPAHGTTLNSAATNADPTLPPAQARAASTAQHKVVAAPTSSIVGLQTNFTERFNLPRNPDFFRPTNSFDPVSALPEAISNFSRQPFSSDALLAMPIDKPLHEISAPATKSAVATSQLMGPPAFIPASRLPRQTGDVQDRVVHLHPHQPTQQYASSQLPPSSPLPPSDHITSSGPANASSSSSQPNSQTADVILTSLREATGLYDLSNEALERVVAEVVREDGFQQLVSGMNHLSRGH
ncbi:hypothetical protein H1R20_g8483, partial [Candolleomyces eurysporus]